MKRILYLILFVSSFVFGQEDINVDLSSPRSTLYTHFYFLRKDSFDPQKAAATIQGLPEEEAQLKVKKIKEILDGKGLRLDFAKIPNNTNYSDSLGYGTRTLIHNKNRYAPFPLRLPAIYVEKTGNNWYFSKETLAEVDKLYKETFSLELTWFQDRFPEFFETRSFGILIWKPLAILIIFLFSVILYYILEPIIFFILRNVQKIFARKSSNENVSLILHELARPLVFVVILKFIKMILPSIQLVEWNALLITGIKIAETVFWIVVLLKIAKVLLSIYHGHNEDDKSKLDRQLAPILNKVVQGFVILVGFLHILTLFGVDPTTVLAGASIGGIAVAFAAQDSVKNLIGTIVIFLDKPFQLGDWVAFSGVEGSVESVGFRSTIIRAADTTIYQIPNSKISEADINNKGLRVYRRYTTELGVRYDTPPELIEAFIQGIKRIITLHPSTKSQAYNVDFIAFGDSSLKILVNVYFEGLDWGEEQASKHILHLAIVKLAAALGVQFAFPSSTLMIEELPGQSSLAPKYETNKEEVEKKLDKIMADFEYIDHKIDPNVSTEIGG